MIKLNSLLLTSSAEDVVKALVEEIDLGIKLDPPGTPGISEEWPLKGSALGPSSGGQVVNADKDYKNIVKPVEIDLEVTAKGSTSSDAKTF